VFWEYNEKKYTGKKEVQWEILEVNGEVSQVASRPRTLIVITVLERVPQSYQARWGGGGKFEESERAKNTAFLQHERIGGRVERGA